MQPGMVVTPETFRLHLQWVRKYFKIVKLDDWITNIGKGDSNSGLWNACAITFDDGWRDTFQFAFPILQKEQIPATMFVVSDMISTNRSFWPERLARVLQKRPATFSTEVVGVLKNDWLKELGVRWESNGGAPSRNMLDRIIDKAKAYPDDLLNRKISALEKATHMEPSKEPDVLSWDQIRVMTRSGLITVGSHGRTHTRLKESLSDKELQSEIRDSKRSLATKLGHPIEVFCYPNGEVTTQAEQFVKQHYFAACTTSRGWNSPDTDRYRLKRISIHEDATNYLTGFLAKLSEYP